MKPALTQKELDELGCGNPDCGHDHAVLVLHSVCHIKKGTWVEYRKATGELKVVCAQCGKEVARILVAKEVEE